MRKIRTDLAMESVDGENGEILPGVDVNKWEESGVAVTEVVIHSRETAQKMGKREGRYLTVESDALISRDPDARRALANVLGEEAARLLPESPDENAPVLVVGLGNRDITPDSLGPAVADRMLVTRHLKRELPDAVRDMASVCAVAPGVLGVTGVETAEAVESLCRKIAPRAVICIDSLAARSTSRIGSSVQLSDAGIAPGSGVGNHRRALDEAVAGCPVIAVGMPTVIYAATLARDAMEYLDPAEEDEDALNLAEEELLRSEMGDMIVTPRNIDELVTDAAGLIADALNRALQPNLSDEEIRTLTD